MMAKKQTLGKHITPAETQIIYNWILEGKSNKEVFAYVRK
jgi:DNA-binding CsgD family transcriptional regulator